MERGKRVEGEIPLPESIIQDIQCRLSRKEAAQTTVLSKFWYRAWLTRPDINLDLAHIQRRGRALIPNPFPEYARQTMRRYDELNLKIKTFRLCMKGLDNDDKLLVGELITKAMQLGAEDMDFEFTPLSSRYLFILPHELLGSENLVRLSLSSGGFYSVTAGGISMSNLKFFGLCRVYIEGDVLWDVMMRCPLVEKLELSHCSFMFEYCPLTNENIYLDFGPYGFGAQKFVNNSIVLYRFYRLTYLILSHVKISPRFLHDFSSKFPCVKDLTLSYCLGPKKIHIHSNSLQSITITQKIKLRATIDVSSLRRFSLSSHHIPSLTFGTVSGEWESHVRVSCSNFLNNKWFHHFKKFLKVMSPSKLYLYLDFIADPLDNLNLSVGIKSVPVLLETSTLMVNVSSLEIHSFWDGLFWSCRPELITTYYTPIYDMGALEAAYRRLINVDDDCYSANKGMIGQSDLEEVIMHVFDETADEWMPVSWKTLIDASTSTETEQKICCFLLRWKK